MRFVSIWKFTTLFMGFTESVSVPLVTIYFIKMLSSTEYSTVIFSNSVMGAILVYAFTKKVTLEFCVKHVKTIIIGEVISFPLVSLYFMDDPLTRMLLLVILVGSLGKLTSYAFKAILNRKFKGDKKTLLDAEIDAYRPYGTMIGSLCAIGVATLNIDIEVILWFQSFSISSMQALDIIVYKDLNKLQDMD